MTALQYIMAPLAYGLLSTRTRFRDFLLFSNKEADSFVRDRPAPCAALNEKLTESNRSPQFGTISFNLGRRQSELTLLVVSKIFFFFYRYFLPIYFGSILVWLRVCFF